MSYDYDDRMIAAQRNIESIFVGLNHFETKRVADSKRVEDLMMTLTQQNQQIAMLLQQVQLLQVALYEAGIR